MKKSSYLARKISMLLASSLANRKFDDHRVLEAPRFRESRGGFREIKAQRNFQARVSKI